MTSDGNDLLVIMAIGVGLGLLPFLVITFTSFIKIAVVMFLIRNALGIQQTPPNLVLYAIAVVLALYISSPVIAEVYANVNDPALTYETFSDWERAAEGAKGPVKEYLQRFTSAKEREFFMTATARIWSEEAQQQVSSEDLIILVPSFIVSELTRAFEIGFLLYLPFIVIDLVVSAVLMSLGMIMVSPLVISVPFKLFLFVIVDGWSRLMHGLVLSYG